MGLVYDLNSRKSPESGGFWTIGEETKRESPRKEYKRKSLQQSLQQKKEGELERGKKEEVGREMNWGGEVCHQSMGYERTNVVISL